MAVKKTQGLDKKLLQNVIDRLLTKYPNRLPTKELTAFELGREVGRQDVIQFLIDIYNKE